MDDNHIRCARCGFPNRERNITVDPRLTWGIVQADITTGTRTIKDPVVVGGCSQCGTFKYRRKHA